MNTLKTLLLLLCIATIQIVVAQSTSVAVTDYSSQPAYRSGMIYLKLKDNAQIYLPKFKRGDKFDNYPKFTDHLKKPKALLFSTLTALSLIQQPM